MVLQRFIRQESSILSSRILIMLFFSGLATGLLVSVINHAADTALSVNIEARILFLYITVFLLYIYTQKYALAHTIYPFDDALYKLRLRLIKKVMACDLSVLENMPGSNIQEYLSRELNLAAQLLPWVTYSAQAAAVLVFCLIYLAWLSTSAFLAVAITLAIAALWHLFIEKDILSEFQQIRATEHELAQKVELLSRQAIPLRSNQTQRKHLLNTISEISKRSEHLKLSIDRQTISSIMSTRIALFLLLAVFVFLIPLYDRNHLDIVFKITVVTFFIMGPVSQLVYALPLLFRLNVALESLYAFEAQLNTTEDNVGDNNNKKTNKEQNLPFDHDFHALRFSSVSFSYADKPKETDFLFDGLNLSINQGEIIFIQANNAQGKTSLLKLLCGLYLPYTGSVYVHKHRLTKQDYPLYRDLFACVFHDKGALGDGTKLTHSAEKIHHILEQTGLQDALEYRMGELHHQHLSSSQQWRLALVYALLSDKPILLIDDSGSIQDEAFVKVFYEEILEELRSERKTVILVNQHKHFEASADRIWQVCDGEIKCI